MKKRAFYPLILTAAVMLCVAIGGCQSTETTKAASSSDTEPIQEAVQEKVATTDQAKVSSKESPEARAVTIERRDNAGLLSVDKTELKFGQIEPRAKVTGEYLLTNTGKETLEIDKVGKSCGCTVPNLETKILEPGQSVPLKITFNASDRPGKVKKSVWITTKAPHKPEKLNMTLTAEVIQFIDVQPARLNLTIQDAADTAKITLKSMDDQPFKVTGINSTTNTINADFDPSVSSTVHELNLKIDSPKLRKAIRGNVVVKIDHPKTKSVTIAYQAARPFVAKPGSKFLRNLAPGKSFTESVTIVSNAGDPFELGDIRSDKGLIEVLSTNSTKDGYVVQFKLDVPEDQTGQVRDILSVAIKDHPEDTVRVTCYGRIKQ